MKLGKNLAKKLPFYWELRLFYQSFKKYGIRRGLLYPYYRFWIHAKLLRAGQSFDRPVDTTMYSLHMMCGHRDLAQFIWSLMSWYRVTSESPQVYIHDDGTFLTEDVRHIQRLFPHARVIAPEASTQSAISQWLVDYPVARALRQTRMPKSIKLIDPYFMSEAEHVLLLDTDIVWFRSPQELFEHIDEHDDATLFWTNKFPEQFVFQDGTPLDEDLAYCNSGVLYFAKNRFDLTVLEEFLQRRDAEQTLRDQPGYAYILAKSGQIRKLPPEKYIIKGHMQQSTVARHYTSPRREKFWIEGVRFLHKTYSIC